MRYRWQYTVRGDMAFPLDMLRYDACHPTSQESVAEIDASLQREERAGRRSAGKPFVVKLASYVGAPEAKRWSSFGWRVGDERKEKVA